MTQSTTQEHLKEPRDAVLWQKARQLQASPLFVFTTDDQPLHEKQSIFLVLAGLKPMAEASSGHWVATDDGRHSVYDDPVAVGALLDSLGLAYRLRHDQYATDALVSLRPELLDAYEAASAAGDQPKIGELFGYPATAAAAFAAGDEQLLPFAEQERVEQAAGVPSMFRFSREHWREEADVERTWLRALELYELLEP